MVVPTRLTVAPRSIPFGYVRNPISIVSIGLPGQKRATDSGPSYQKQIRLLPKNSLIPTIEQLCDDADRSGIGPHRAFSASLQHGLIPRPTSTVLCTLHLRTATAACSMCLHGGPWETGSGLCRALHNSTPSARMTWLSTRRSRESLQNPGKFVLGLDSLLLAWRTGIPIRDETGS